MKLFLDDIRNPYDVFRLTINPLYENDKDWVIARDYYQFIDAINKCSRDLKQVRIPLTWNALKRFKSDSFNWADSSP